MMVDVSRRPSVQGSARPINSFTGVGNIDSEGPNSRVKKVRWKKPKYCSAKEPSKPKACVSVARIASTCSASM